MPSIAEIARHAEVSRCAASQILNKSRGYERFSSALRQHVLHIADQLGWERDSRGLALQQGRTGVLALALPGGAARQTGLMHTIISVVERAARKHDQYLQIIGGSIADAVQAVHSHRCDGVMALGWSVHAEDAQFMRGCNHVCLCSAPDGLNGLALDSSAGLTRAVSHLHSLGHRRILWLYADINDDHQPRYACIQRVADKFNIQCQPLEFHYPGTLGMNEEHEVATMRAVLKKNINEIKKYSAVICFNELLGIALYGALSGMVRIPQDISIIGIDDVYAPLAVPSMTSVSFNLDKMADEAVQMLLHPPQKHQVKYISSALSIRTSTGRVPDR